MAETLSVAAGNKHDQYTSLLPQIKALTESETDMLANMANTCAALQQVFSFLWVGFYIVKGDELVLGPFQGPVACTRIAKGKGVCGTAWERNTTQVVADVDAFPGHIACSSESRSEIVVPVHDQQGDVIAVLDIDSAQPAYFDEIDQQQLETLVRSIFK
ncbi:GAF domain-containing protein [Bermanella sp. R86510]|uniref:GAF domain-containing protein n=1 Tax=unclassified Bermanella TaxID=2627862 RepID=UPI0037C99EB3